MSKARMYGSASSYTPNAKADMRFKQKAFYRRKYTVEDDGRLESMIQKKNKREKEKSYV